MAWTTPLTAVANAALTAAQWNATVRDNFAETAPAKATAAGRFFATSGTNTIAERVPAVSFVAASETTTSTTYANLATSGPAVTSTTGPVALVGISLTLNNDTTGSNTFSSFAVSGATTIAANDNWMVGYAVSLGGRPIAGGVVKMQTGLAAGSNTFTQQYRVSGGTGTFSGRYLWVLPF